MTVPVKLQLPSSQLWPQGITEGLLVQGNFSQIQLELFNLYPLPQLRVHLQLQLVMSNVKPLPQLLLHMLPPPGLPRQLCPGQIHLPFGHLEGATVPLGVKHKGLSIPSFEPDEIAA